MRSHGVAKITLHQSLDGRILLALSHIPPGLPVIGIPTPNRFVWVELTVSAYDDAVAAPEVARQVTAYAGEVLACRLLKARKHAIE
jgi:hypothetical protein